MGSAQGVSRLARCRARADPYPGLVREGGDREGVHEGAEAGALSILSASILKLTLDTSPQAVTASRAALKRLPPARERRSGKPQ